MKIDTKEKIIFFIVSILIFLPVRFLFFTFVSDWWVGSFGAISIVMIVLLLLTKKDKLGWLGRLWKRQIVRISKGKLGLLGMIHSVFFIIFLSSIVIVTDTFQDTSNEEFAREMMAEKGVTDLTGFASHTITADHSQLLNATAWGEVNPDDFIIALTGTYAVLDDFTYGFHQHFSIVLLIEEIEILGFVIYFRYIHKKPEVLNK